MCFRSADMFNTAVAFMRYTDVRHKGAPKSNNILLC